MQTKEEESETTRKKKKSHCQEVGKETKVKCNFDDMVEPTTGESI